MKKVLALGVFVALWVIVKIVTVLDDMIVEDPFEFDEDDY